MKRAMFKAIIEENLPKYIKASLPEKLVIVSSIVEVSGIPRKAIVRALNRERKRSNWQAPPRLGRPRIYLPETEAALAFIWEQYDYPCAERLYDEIHEAIRIFVRDGLWNYSQSATEQLLKMSLGSMKVRTAVITKKKGLLRGQSTTKSGELLKSVPVFFGSWNKKASGNGQIDTVVHSGPKLMGNMAFSVNYVDVATYWQEPVAQLNKSERATLTSNELYEVLRLYLNFFQPTFKLQAKQKRVKACDGKQYVKPYKRVYDKPRSPYRRVLERLYIDQLVKDKLTVEYETLNPKVLRDRINSLTIKLERTQRELGYHY